MLARLRRMEIRWPVVAVMVLLAVGLIVYFIISGGKGLAASKQRENEKQILYSQKEQEMSALVVNINSVGKNAYIEAEARKEGMIKEDELIFRVENPERLDCYTLEEWQLLMDERQIDLDSGT